MPCSLPSVLSISSPWIFLFSLQSSISSFLYEAAWRDSRTCLRHRTCSWLRWTAGSYIQGSVYRNSKFSQFQELPSVCGKSDVLPCSSFDLLPSDILIFISSMTPHLCSFLLFLSEHWRICVYVKFQNDYNSVFLYGVHFNPSVLPLSCLFFLKYNNHFHYLAITNIFKKSVLFSVCLLLWP